MTAESTSSITLRRPVPSDVDTIAGWHPMSPDEVLRWWATPDVEPWAMVDSGGSLIGYGELWLEADEDEVELARLIVAPKLRGQGHGKRLTQAMMSKAGATGMATIFLRVTPDNNVAIACYRACGFEQLGPEDAAVWNEGQRREWVWMLPTTPAVE